MNSYKRRLMVEAVGFLILTQSTPILSSDATLKRSSAEAQSFGLPAKKIACDANLVTLEMALKNNSIHTLDELPSLLQSLPKHQQVNLITKMFCQYSKENKIHTLKDLWPIFMILHKDHRPDFATRALLQCAITNTLPELKNLHSLIKALPTKDQQADFATKALDQCLEINRLHAIDDFLFLIEFLPKAQETDSIIKIFKKISGVVAEDKLYNLLKLIKTRPEAQKIDITTKILDHYLAKNMISSLPCSSTCRLVFNLPEAQKTEYTTKILDLYLANNVIHTLWDLASFIQILPTKDQQIDVTIKIINQCLANRTIHELKTMHDLNTNIGKFIKFLPTIQRHAFAIQILNQYSTDNKMYTLDDSLYSLLNCLPKREAIKIEFTQKALIQSLTTNTLHQFDDITCFIKILPQREQYEFVKKVLTQYLDANTLHQCGNIICLVEILPQPEQIEFVKRILTQYLDANTLHQFGNITYFIKILPQPEQIEFITKILTQYLDANTFHKFGKITCLVEILPQPEQIEFTTKILNQYLTNNMIHTLKSSDNLLSLINHLPKDLSLEFSNKIAAHLKTTHQFKS